MSMLTLLFLRTNTYSNTACFLWQWMFTNVWQQWNSNGTECN